MQDPKAARGGARLWLSSALAIFFIAALAAEAKSADQLSELMKLSTLDMYFDRFGDHLKVRMKRALPDSPLGAAYKDKVLAGLDRAADEAFAPETLKREFRLALDGKVTEAGLDSVLAFYKSPLGVRLKALEKESQTADAQAKIAKMAGRLLERLKNEPRRAEVLTLIDGSLRLTELSTDTAFNLGRAMAIGMAAADPKTTALVPAAIEAIDSDMQEARPAIIAEVKVTLVPFMAYTYREATIGELRQYLVFASSPAGKSYYGAVEPAVNQVLVKAGEEFGHALMKELGKEHA
jgi:hypothetical protein